MDILEVEILHNYFKYLKMYLLITYRTAFPDVQLQDVEEFYLHFL